MQVDSINCNQNNIATKRCRYKYRRHTKNYPTLKQLKRWRQNRIKQESNCINTLFGQALLLYFINMFEKKEHTF